MAEEPVKSLPRGLVFIVGGVLLLGLSGALIAAAAQAVVHEVVLDSLGTVAAGQYVQVSGVRLQTEAAFPATEANTASLVPVRAAGDSLAGFDSCAFAAVRKRDMPLLEGAIVLRGSVLSKRPPGVPQRAVVVDVAQTPDTLSRGGLMLSALGFFLLTVGILRRILSARPKPSAEAGLSRGP